MDVQAFTVYDMIARAASVHGDAPAVIQADRPLSFRQFKDRADALAGGLAALGIGKGERICILAQNDLAYLDLYGACAREGIVAYPINWRLTADEVEHVLERAARPGSRRSTLSTERPGKPRAPTCHRPTRSPSSPRRRWTSCRAARY